MAQRPTRDQLNCQNLQACINSHNQLGYIQRGNTVLLGAGHAQNEVDWVNSAPAYDPTYSGTLTAYKDKTKKILQQTEKSLIVLITPNKKGRMGELEGAIEAAAVGTDVSGWPIKYEWGE